MKTIDVRRKLGEVLGVLRAVERWVRVRRAPASTRADEIAAEVALEAAWSLLEGDR